MTTDSDANHAEIVKPEEMQDARQWLAEMLAAVAAVRDPEEATAEVTCLHHEWRTMQTALSVIETPLCLAGAVHETGFGTHAPSRIRVRLPAGGRWLSGACGVDDHEYARAHALPITFAVRTGPRELWTSGPRRVADQPARFRVALGGAREFLLETRPDTPGCAPADWADLKVVLRDGRVARLGQPVRGGPGFGFTYGGKPSAEFLAGWNLRRQRRPAGPGVIVHRLTRTDPKTGLAVTCAIKEYLEFPVAEWVLRFKNTSRRKTPIIAAIRSLEICAKLGKFPYLDYWTGDYCAADGYEPFRVSLAHGEEFKFAPAGGRATDRAWPYYNLESSSAQRGMIIVVGWPGQWASCFRGLDDHAVSVTAGQELTHLSLLPGEEIRTPLSVLLFYRGDRVRSRNLWRRWMHAHNVPRPDGRPLEPHLACAATDEGEEFTAATEENQIRYLRKFKERGIHPDVWWIDAGWYPCHDEKQQRRWPRTGTWKPDPERFPRGLKPISQSAAQAGADLLVWFEPERVTAGSQLDVEHPDWLLRKGEDQNRLLNLGNPQCRQWLTDHVCRLIQDNGIKIYRQDFNFPPLEYWRGNDASDRQGITENLHVQGYLRYWDDLLARNPGLWIDSCASGGRRNDLETMRRSVPLHYSDYGYGDHPVKLAFHRALYEWLPYFKDCTLSWDLRGTARFDHRVDRYSFHCGLAPMLFATLDIRRDDYDFALAGKMIALWRRASDLLLYGDYYPLTPYHRSADQWVVRQFDCPAEGRGFIQGIRLPAAPVESLVVHPQALVADAVYRFENPETGETRECTGRAARDEGIAFALPKRQAAIWFYGIAAGRGGLIPTTPTDRTDPKGKTRAW